MNLIEQIYEAIEDDEALRSLPAAVASSVGARSCVILGFDDRLRLRNADVSYFSPDMIEFQRQNDVRDWDIWTSYGALPQQLGKIANSDEIWDRRAFKDTPFFNECIRPFGDDTISCLGGVLRTQDGYTSLAVHHGDGSKPFTGADAQRVDGHLPHLARMFEIRARLRAERTRGDLLQAALDGMGDAVLAVNKRLQIQATNAKAEAILAQADGFRIVGHRLSAVKSVLQDRLVQAVLNAAEKGRADAILVARAGDLPPFRVLVAPLRHHRSTALLLIGDPSQAAPNLLDTLVAMYGLTAREASLAVQLAEGLTPEEAAEHRGVRLTTVRTQIQSLLAKTESGRASRLLTLIASLPKPSIEPI